MMRILAIIVIITTINQDRIIAQGNISLDSTMDENLNILYVECWGNAGGYNPIEIFSINYERHLFSNQRRSGWIRLGSNIPRIGKYPKTGIYQVHNIPIMLNFVFGRRFAFVVGVGGQIHIVNSKYRDPDFAFTSLIGVQYYTGPRGLLIRVGLTPTLGQEMGAMYTGNIIGAALGTIF